MDTTEAIALKSLLSEQKVAALATLHKGGPAVSMVPYAMLPTGAGFVIHVSRLATHTSDMLDNPSVALLVTAPLTETVTPLALPRASIQGLARQCRPESPEYAQARAAYLARLPEAEELFAFADFSLFLIEPQSLRYVAGFGRAMSLASEQIGSVLGSDA